MARLTGAFNEAGVKRADVSAQDVMLRFGLKDSPEPTDAFKNGQSITPNPIFEEPGSADNYMDTLIEGNDRKETLMEVMYPDRDYKAPKIDAKSMIRDANKAVTDGNIVARKAAGGMEAVKEQQASFKQDWAQAKTEAVSMLKDAAKDMEINPDEATDQMVAKGPTSSIGMLASAGAGVAMGGGSLATAGSAALYLKQELSKEDKKLSPKQQEALLADTLKRLQESRKPVDTREAENTGGKNIQADDAVESPKQSEISWENMTMEDLAELLQADPEGEDQEEMLELRQTEHELEMVQLNHEYVKEHYADNATMDKMTASAQSGNSAMVGLMNEATEVKGIDSSDVELTRAGVTGIISGVKVDPVEAKFASVETSVDMFKINEASVKQQLDMDINRQFSV